MTSAVAIASVAPRSIESRTWHSGQSAGKDSFANFLAMSQTVDCSGRAKGKLDGGRDRTFERGGETVPRPQVRSSGEGSWRSATRRRSATWLCRCPSCRYFVLQPKRFRPVLRKGRVSPTAKVRQSADVPVAGCATDVNCPPVSETPIYPARSSPGLENWMPPIALQPERKPPESVSCEPGAPAQAVRPPAAKLVSEDAHALDATAERSVAPTARSCAISAAVSVDEAAIPEAVRADRTLDSNDLLRSTVDGSQVKKARVETAPAYSKPSSPPKTEAQVTPQNVSSEQGDKAKGEQSSLLAGTQTFEWVKVVSAAQPVATNEKHIEPATPVNHKSPIRIAPEERMTVEQKPSSEPKPKEDRAEGKAGSSTPLAMSSVLAAPLASGKPPLGVVETTGVPISVGRPLEGSPDSGDGGAQLPRSVPSENQPTPLPSPGVQVARIASIGGQSEMHIGVRTTTFRTVEVHAVVHDSQVGLAIAAERGDLHRLLANEVPGISGRLEQQDLRLDNVKFLDLGFPSDGGFGSGADSRSREFNTPRSFSSYGQFPRADEPAGYSGSRD